MHILITGGAGFIGSNLVKYLRNADDISTISVYDNFSTGSRENLRGIDVEIFDCDILDVSNLNRAVRDVDRVVHLAAIPSVPRSIANPVASHEANITGTFNVLEAARAAKVRQVIVASSSSVYGSNPDLPKSEMAWTRPMSPYAVTKQASEAYAAAYSYTYGLDTLAFRFFNVYGPGQAANHAYAAVVPKFLAAAIAGEPLTVHGDGEQTRDFTYVGTVVRTLYAALHRHVTSEHPVNLAFGTSHTVNELIRLMETTVGKELPRIYADERVGDVRNSQADPSSLRGRFPEIEPTSLKVGLSDTYDWMLKQVTTGARGHRL